MDGIDKKRAWLALSPLPVFLVVYLVSSLVAHDFYKVPVASAFLLASIYGLAITPGPVNRRIEIFSRGAANPNILLMIWIFILAGAFASTAKAIGAVEATVNLTLMILPGKLILAGLFLASCFISMAVGTSVGTIVALVPIAAGISSQTDFALPMVTAIIVGGAFFGDNLSFISDTTIAATRSQDCSMSDKFKTNIWIAGPAAAIVTVVYIVMGFNSGVSPEIGEVNPILLAPYLAVIVLALCSVNVVVVLCIGLGINALIGFIGGYAGWVDFLGSVGSGISGMGELIIVTLLAGGMLEVIRDGGGIDLVIKGMTKGIKGRRGAEFSIAGLVGICNFCTANNTIAIITSGGIAKDISDRFGLDPRRVASILDTFSCVVQGIIPYGAQMLMASGLAGISPADILVWLYYPMALLVMALLSILLRFPGRAL